MNVACERGCLTRTPSYQVITRQAKTPINPSTSSARARAHLTCSHSPDVTGLSVHALPAIVDSSTAPVNSRNRPCAVPGTRWTRCSPIIALPGGREGARPASRLRHPAWSYRRERVSLPLYHPLSFPATRRRLHVGLPRLLNHPRQTWS